MAGRVAVALAFSSLALSSLALLWPARAAPTTSTPVSSPSGSVIDHIRDLRTPWGVVTLNRYRPYAVDGEEADAWQPAGATSPPFERWTSGGGIWEVVTRYGPGFKMVCTPEMVTPWKDSEHETKATFLADAEHLVRGAGYTEDWSGNVMFPSRGNPTGFPRRWHAGVLVEFHTETSTGMHLAIDGLGRAPRFRFGVHDPTTDGYRFSYFANRIRFGRWYSWRMKIKWSEGRDGYFRGWVDGRLVASSDGPTLKSGEHPKLQFGFYSIAEQRNEVWYSAIRKS